MNRPRIAVLGLGNLMRTDDALGMLALERLRADPRFPKTVTLIEGGTLGLDLLYPLEGVTHLLALDAIDADAEPGTLLRYAGEAVAELPVSKSVHLLGFSDLMGALRLVEQAPREVVVLGLQPALTEWGTELTPAAEAGLPTLVECALGQVTRWLLKVAEDASPQGATAGVMAAGGSDEALGALASLAAGEETWYW